MYVFRRDTFRLKHSVSRVATAMEDDSAAEHSTEQIKTRGKNKISLSHARSATEHRANEAVTTQHMQGSAAAQCAPVSEHTSQASISSELVQWVSFGPQPPTQTIGIWQVQFPKQWIEYDPEINTDIERQYQNGERVDHFQQCRSKKRDWWDDYTIEFDRMEQRNTRSNRVRKVRRIERSVCGAWSTAPLPRQADELTGVWSGERR